MPLIGQYENLLVVQTFSKSRCLAGGRVGLAFGSPALIAGLNRVRYSFHPYNVNRLSILAGAAAMEDGAYLETCVREVIKNREHTRRELEALGFSVLPSCANFLFAGHPDLPGGDLYRSLKEKGVLVRWFDADRLRDRVRVSIGSAEQMAAFLSAVRRVLDER